MGPPMTPQKFGVNIFSRFLSMHSKWYSQIFVLAPLQKKLHFGPKNESNGMHIMMQIIDETKKRVAKS